jgi:hypothetical protein
MNYLTITYSLYLFFSVTITVWVGNTLFKHGRVFLVEIFRGNTEMADAVNKLLLVGFYLINTGYAVFSLSTSHSVGDLTSMIERLSLKVGGIILTLGLMHFFNLFLLFRLRKKSKESRFPIANAE